MKIRMNDDRTFHGTPLQIVRAMQGIAFGVEGLPLRKYIESAVESARQFEGIALAAIGDTDGQLAASLIVGDPGRPGAPSVAGARRSPAGLGRTPSRSARTSAPNAAPDARSAVGAPRRGRCRGGGRRRPCAR